MESRKMVEVNLFAEQKQSHTCREQTYGHQMRKLGEGWIGRLGWKYTHYYV